MTQPVFLRSVRRFKNAAAAVFHQLYVDLNRDYRNSVFLAGSGRGGTTWVAELINYDNAYRFIFEPFNARRVPMCRNFRNRQYIRPNCRDTRFVAPARRIISGGVRSLWSDSYNARVVSHRRLIKDVRANLFLKWLHGLFPEMPIVLLLRHPCAVAASRLRYDWHDDLNDFLEQDELIADLLSPFRDRMARVTDPFEKHIWRWCVENWVPLRQCAPGDIHLAFYEDFRHDPERAIGALFTFLRQPVRDSVFDRLNIPSRMAWKSASEEATASKLGESWRRVITPAQLRQARDILELFGLHGIYADDMLPNKEAALSLMAHQKQHPVDVERASN